MRRHVGADCGPNGRRKRRARTGRLRKYGTKTRINAQVERILDLAEKSTPYRARTRSARGYGVIAIDAANFIGSTGQIPAQFGRRANVEIGVQRAAQGCRSSGNLGVGERPGNARNEDSLRGLKHGGRDGRCDRAGAAFEKLTQIGLVIWQRSRSGRGGRSLA